MVGRLTHKWGPVPVPSSVPRSGGLSLKKSPLPDNDTGTEAGTHHLLPAEGGYYGQWRRRMLPLAFRFHHRP